MRPSTSADAAAERLPNRGSAAVRTAVEGARRHPTALVVGFLLLLTIAFFNPVFTGGHFSTLPSHHSAVYPWIAEPNGIRFYPQSDQTDLSHPWNTFLTHALDDGAFPFWDPHSYGGGYALFANGSSALIYPPRLLPALLLDPVTAHDVYLMIHVLGAGLAMYALGRELAVGRAGSLLAAVSWMFAGFNMAWMHLEVVTPMSVFLPLDMLAVHRAHRTGRARDIVLAGVALGATLMSGHLVLLGLVYMAAALYAACLAVAPLWRALRARNWRDGLAAVLRPAAIGAVSIGFAMVVLLPTAVALSGSHRDPFTYDELVESFLAPERTAIHALVPPPLPVTGELMHEMTFAGTLTGVLAFVGVLVRRRRGAWLGRTMLLGAFAIAVGTPLTWFAYHFVPGFDVFRPYSRLLVFSTFAIALLGGLGLDAVWRRAEAADGAAPKHRRSGVLLARPAVAVLSVLVVGASAVQLGRYGRDVNPPFVPAEVDDYLERTPLIAALEREIRSPGEWPGRMLPTRVFPAGDQPGAPMLFAATALPFRLDTMGGYDSVMPRRVSALLRALQGEDLDTVLERGLPAAYAPVFESLATRFHLATRLGVTVLATNPEPPIESVTTPAGPLPPIEVAYEGLDGRILRLVGASAAPYLVYGQEIVETADDAFRRFVSPDFDHTRAVVVERDELERTDVGPVRTEGAQAGAGVGEAERGINSASVTVTTSSPAWLAFHESWAAGWSATVNGDPAELVRVNYAKRAVQVPAGRSVVELRYRPPGLVVGGIGTSLTLFACAAALVGSRPTRRRRA